MSPSNGYTFPTQLSKCFLCSQLWQTPVVNVGRNLEVQSVTEIKGGWIEGELEISMLACWKAFTLNALLTLGEVAKKCLILEGQIKSDRGLNVLMGQFCLWPKRTAKLKIFKLG